MVDLSTADHPGAVDLGNVAVIPGLVNCHTHLEFSDLDHPLQPPRPFTAWIQTVMGHRRQRGMLAPEIIVRGLQECSRSGTVQVGEITTEETTLAILEKAPIAITSYREIIGLQPERVGDLLQAAERHLQERTPAIAAAEANGRATSGDSPLRRGLCPHAPYSVHPELFHKLVELACRRDAPLAMHLAETQAEVQLLERGNGSFVALLQSLGLWKPDLFPPGGRVLDYLRPLAETRRALLIHGNYLADEDIRFLASHPHLTVVYCPRTHAFFGHRAHPWQELLARGGSVALGTDSRASNPDLSLWNELAFLRRRFAEVNPRVLLELGTRRAARALGSPETTGTLVPGSPADLAVVFLKPADGDPFEQLFSEGNRIAATMRAGRWISGSDEHATNPELSAARNGYAGELPLAQWPEPAACAGQSCSALPGSYSIIPPAVQRPSRCEPPAC